MSITKEQLQALFQASAAREFADIPEEDALEHTFSQEFEARSEALIRSVGRPASRWFNTAAKRVAIIAVLVLAFFASAFSVKAVREPVSRFITEVYEHCLYVLVEGKMNITIQTTYQLTEIPEGYHCVCALASEHIVQTVFQNDAGELLYLEQTTAAAGFLPMDTQEGTLTNTTIGRIPVLLYDSEEYVQACWVHEHYFFCLTHHGSLRTEQLLSLIPYVQAPAQ